MAVSLIADLIDRVQRRSDRVDPQSRVRVLDALDEALQWYSKKMPFGSLMRFEEFQCSGSEFMVFPNRIMKVIDIADLTNTRMVEPGDHWKRRHTGTYLQRTQGVGPCEWRDLGIVPVISQPNTDTTLTFQCTASDSFNTYVKGLVRDTTASGTALEFFEAEETISITGSDVKTSANAYVQVIGIEKKYPTNGDLIVKETGSAVPISRMARWEARPEFPRAQFLVVPNAGTRLEVEYFRRPDRIAAEEQTLDPAVHEDALIWRAVGNQHWMDQEGQQANLAWQKANEVAADQKSVEEMFGEKDHHMEPVNFYFEAEGLNQNNG